MAKFNTTKQRVPLPFMLCDTETTGLRPGLGHKDDKGNITNSGEIIQLAAMGIDGSSLEPHPCGDFYALIKPQYPELASAGAIAVVGEEHFNDACLNGHDPKTVFQEYDAWCRKIPVNRHGANRPLFTAFNEGFDRGMLEFAYHHYGLVEYGDDDAYPWGRSFCVMNAFYMFFHADPAVQNMKLDTCLATVGLARDTDTHNAMADVKLTYELLKRIMQFARRCRGKMVLAAPQQEIATQ